MEEIEATNNQRESTMDELGQAKLRETEERLHEHIRQLQAKSTAMVSTVGLPVWLIIPVREILSQEVQTLPWWDEQLYIYVCLLGRCRFLNLMSLNKKSLFCSSQVAFIFSRPEFPQLWVLFLIFFFTGRETEETAGRKWGDVEAGQYGTE